MLARVRKSALLLSCVVLCCCFDDGGCEDEPIELSCDMPYTGADLHGTWTLRASGERSGCRQRRFDGELTIETTVDLPIAAMAVPTSGSVPGLDADDEADAFVERIERADFELSGGAVPSRLSFAGSVQGSCVSFTMSERLEDGDSLVYHFEGYISRAGYVEGNFRGEGPENCDSSGTFEVDVD